MAKSPDAFRTISEVAEWLDIPAHVLRFWESRFTQVRPVKRAGGRRYYRPEDIRLLGGIKTLLHDEGLTIKGVQKILRERGVRHVADLAPDLDALPQAPPLPAPQLPVPADEVEEAGLLEDVEEEDVPATILAFPERGTAAEAGSDGPSQNPGADQAAMAGGGEQGAPGADNADAASTEPREDDEDDEKNAVPADPSPGDGQARLDGRGHALESEPDAGRRAPAEVEPDRRAGEPGGQRDMNAERDSTAADAPDPAQPSAFGESLDAAPDRPHPDDIYSREPALPAPLLGPLLLADPEALAARAPDLAPILKRLDGLLARRD